MNSDLPIRRKSFNALNTKIQTRPGILVDIDEAYTQCSKAFLRSHFWDPQRHIAPSTMPTGGEIHRAIQGDQFDAQAYDRERAERYRRRVGFY